MGRFAVLVCLFGLIVGGRSLKAPSIRLKFPRAGVPHLSGCWTAVRNIPGKIMDVARVNQDGSMWKPPQPPPGMVDGVMDWSRNAILSIPLFNRGNQTVDSDAVMHASLDDLAPRAKALESWWKGKTEGRRGLLVWFMPSILSQLVVLQTILPFFVDRFLQYQQPGLLVLAATLSQPLLNNGVKLFISTGIWTGIAYMVYDSWRAGTLWSPFTSSPRCAESYALVTGADEGTGKDMAALLFADGYSIIMVGASRHGLDEAQDDIVRFVRSRRSRLSTSGGSEGMAAAEVITIPCDLSETHGADRLIREITSLGVDKKLDVFVFSPPSSVSASTATTIAGIKSVTHLMEHLLPHMAKRTKEFGKGSRVLILGSTAPLASSPREAMSVASKAYVNSYALSLRRRFLHQGVLVTLAMQSPRPIGGRGKRGSDRLLLLKSCNAIKLYRGLNQGRGVVVPGILDKIYVALLSKVVPPMALTGLTEYWRQLMGTSSVEEENTVRRESFVGSAEIEEEKDSLDSVPDSAPHIKENTASSDHQLESDRNSSSHGPPGRSYNGNDAVDDFSMFPWAPTDPPDDLKPEIPPLHPSHPGGIRRGIDRIML